MPKPFYLVAVAAVAGAAIMALGGLPLRARGPEQSASATPATTVLKRADFVRGVRLSGTVEAVQATAIPAPRLSGQNPNSLVIMRLIKAGTSVQAGDPIVEFDRQDQLRNALDRRAELTDFYQQIKKRTA
jgi:multidrug efflux pump subunit AcrA (membrane-fusion protein)